MPRIPDTIKNHPFRWGMVSAIIGALALILAFCRSIDAVPVMKGEYDGHVEDFQELNIDSKAYRKEQRQVNREVMRSLDVPEAKIREIEDGEAD